MSSIVIVNGSLVLYRAKCPVCDVETDFFTAKEEASNALASHIFTTHSTGTEEVKIQITPTV